jgi:hypothetical protein
MMLACSSLKIVPNGCFLVVGLYVGVSLFELQVIAYPRQYTIENMHIDHGQNFAAISRFPLDRSDND